MNKLPSLPAPAWSVRLLFPGTPQRSSDHVGVGTDDKIRVAVVCRHGCGGLNGNVPHRLWPVDTGFSVGGTIDMWPC